jgi:alpha-amylase
VKYIVIDHLIGGEFQETVRAEAYCTHDRNFLKGDVYDVTVQTHFAYEARKGKYSAFQWHWYHFNSTDYNFDHGDDKTTIVVFEGKSFNQFVSLEKGNFDYLMGCNIDFTNDEAKAEIENWGKWYLETTKANGIRIDAAKHISYNFMSDFINCLQADQTDSLFVMAEYWEPQVESLNAYVTNSGGKIRVFDSPLHYKFLKSQQSWG